MKLLRDQWLSITHLNVVFQSLDISRLTYAVLAWERFLSGEQIRKINAIFKRSFRHGMAKSIVTFQELLNKCADQLFKSIQSISNCLNHIVPVNRHYTRRQGHYDLPTYNSVYYCKSFLLHMYKYQ